MKVGDFVIKTAILDGKGNVVSCSTRDGSLGQIVNIGTAFRCMTGKDEDFYTVKRIDAETGRLMKCPDNRCEGSCAICADADWPEGFVRLTPADEKAYREAGVLKT